MYDLTQQAGFSIASQSVTPKRNNRPPVTTAPPKSSRIGRPGSKRYQRYFNKAYLLQHSDNVTDEDIQIYVTTRSHFSMLIECGNDQIWESFVDFTEESQEELLSSLSAGMEQYRQKIGSEGASKSFRSIDKKIRKIIRSRVDIEYLFSMDQEITDFIKRDIEESSYAIPEPSRRMICHGICQFYSLGSNSKDTHKGERVVFVRKTERSTIPGETLSRYLQRLHL